MSAQRHSREDDGDGEKSKRVSEPGFSAELARFEALVANARATRLIKLPSRNAKSLGAPLAFDFENLQMINEEGEVFGENAHHDADANPSATFTGTSHQHHHHEKEETLL